MKVPHLKYSFIVAYENEGERLLLLTPLLFPPLTRRLPVSWYSLFSFMIFGDKYQQKTTL